MTKFSPNPYSDPLANLSLGNFSPHLYNLIIIFSFLYFAHFLFAFMCPDIYNTPTYSALQLDKPSKKSACYKA